MYSNWYRSTPFDIGQTTETSIKILTMENMTAKDGINRAKHFNSSSKSNGSLMRCMPHSIFGANLAKAKKYKELKSLVQGEVQFVHGNKLVHESIFVYIVSMAYLLNNPDESNRSKKAFDLALKLSQESLANTVDMKYKESVFLWLSEA